MIRSPDGDHHCLGAVRSAELSHRVVHVLFHGSLGDAQNRTDIPGRLAARHPPKNLDLAGRERLLFGPHTVSMNSHSGLGCLQPAPPRAVAEAAGIRRPIESDAALRAPRLSDRAEGASGERSERLASTRSSRSWRPPPGFEPIRSARLVPIVVTPHPFQTKRQSWSYCGLGIVARSSSDWVRAEGQWIRARVPQKRGLSRQFNHVLKSLFKGAATTVITQRHKDPIYACGHRANKLDSREVREASLRQMPRGG